jgi:phage gpG-like protein
MGISAETDFQEWERATYALQARMLKATMSAGRDSMYLIERNVKFYLRTFTHREGTPTPSPRGGPPALVTGNLARSWRNERPAMGVEPWTVITGGGPTAVYARIQELSGQAGRGLQTFIPKRPYVRPMVLASRRGVRRIHMSAWTGAIRG